MVILTTLGARLLPWVGGMGLVALALGPGGNARNLQAT